MQPNLHFSSHSRQASRLSCSLSCNCPRQPMHKSLTAASASCSALFFNRSTSACSRSVKASKQQRAQSAQGYPRSSLHLRQDRRVCTVTARRQTSRAHTYAHTRLSQSRCACTQEDSCRPFRWCWPCCYSSYATNIRFGFLARIDQ